MGSAIAAEKRKLEGRQPTLRQRLLNRLGEWLVYGPIKDQFGLTRLRGAFTGGEAMGEDTFVFYRALGIKLRQLYGQTETSAYNAIQSLDEVRLHTVGRPLPGVDLRISDAGEILVRSGSVFSGYFNQDEATREILKDGWLHTGDAGYLEPDGHLVVLGRLSDVVHTAKGERYIPNYIENRLKFSPYIKDAAVLGRGRDTLSAIICIDKEAVGLWAELRGISYISYADLSQKPQVIALIAAAVKHVNTALPDGLQLRKFVCLHKEFDADDGEITRTRKIRRNVVEERYKPIIDAIYDRQDTVLMKAKVNYEFGRNRRHRTNPVGAGDLTHGLGSAARIGHQRRACRADVFAGRDGYRADLQVVVGAQPGAGRDDDAGSLHRARLRQHRARADLAGDRTGASSRCSASAWPSSGSRCAGLPAGRSS